MATDYTFNNVTIIIEAKSAVEAYNKLCNALGALANSEFSTDTYCEEKSNEDIDTSRLWPKL